MGEKNERDVEKLIVLYGSAKFEVDIYNENGTP